MTVSTVSCFGDQKQKCQMFLKVSRMILKILLHFLLVAICMSSHFCPLLDFFTDLAPRPIQSISCNVRFWFCLCHRQGGPILPVPTNIIL